MFAHRIRVPGGGQLAWSTQRRYNSSFALALDVASKLVTPKFMLKNPVSLVSTEMNMLVKNIANMITSGHPTLNRATSYYFETEGKRVRPLIVLLLSRALSSIPIEERDNIKIDYKDFPVHPVTADIREKILASEPVESFSPLSILHGINTLNPLTQAATPPPEPGFDRERGILPKQRRLAEIVEMIHTASLLHDDVIDYSDMRRGKPSGNIAFTNKMAVLAGDFLLGRATVCISRLRNPEVVELMSNSIANLVEGEFMQLKDVSVEGDPETIDFTGKPLPKSSGKVNVKTHDYRVPQLDELFSQVEAVPNEKEIISNAFLYYLHKSYLKTASLISKSCRSAAILSGARPPVIESCYEFGRNLGLCFQLVDDMLDFTVSAKTLGKPAGADLKLGLTTAPVLYAWIEDASMGPLIKRHFSEPGDVEKALEAVKKYDGAMKTKSLAEVYRDKALKNLRDALPESDSRSALELLTNSILTRTK